MKATTMVRQFRFLVLVAFGAQLVLCSNILYGNETDHLSLLEFKKAINLDPQQALISWNDSSNHFCDWVGVLCRLKAPRRVTSLNLTDRGLEGQISPWLGNLTFLKHLVLSGNAFTGHIPRSLGDHLHHLESLQLSNNKLQGIIPDFANLSNLMVLQLDKNHLSGQIPKDLPYGLQNLSLFENNFTGTIPSSLANITMLRLLDFRSNSIEGTIPNELGKLSKMQSFSMGGNKLAGSFPNALLNISSLTGLSLAFNDLGGKIPSNLGTSLPNLQQLLLGLNFFDGHIPSSIFSNASGLFHLDMSWNNFTGFVPSSIGKLTKLVALNLESNKLKAVNKKDWEFVYSLANCTELQSLSMAANDLEGHVPDSLGNLSVQLQELFLGVNHLSGGFPSGISNLPNLIGLGLHDNRFSGEVPEWLGSLKSLQIIALHDNNFSGFIPESLSNLSQLGTLFLAFNQFYGHLPASLGNLRMLDTLTISNNLISGMIPKEIFGIPTITQISLSSNNLEGQLPREVGNAKQLINFLLSSNKLSGDIPNALGDCESLEYVQLDQNSFSGSIPVSLGNISALRVLNLSHNNLTGPIPVSLGSLQHLEQLDLSYNHLMGQVPTEGIFRNATALRIDGNQELCGGALELHQLACPVMPVKSNKQQKHSFVTKVVVPLLACIVSLVVVVSVVLFWRGKQKANILSSPSFDIKFAKVSYTDLARATEGFSGSNLIGRGRYSSVYQGKLFQDTTVVAVKVFSLETSGAQKSFIAECNALRNLRHRNLVPILTACSSSDPKGNDFKALVYKFMSRGDLHALLYSTQNDANTSSPSSITLAQRLCIVVDVADALEYLHHNNQGTIIHCDLKPSNILLDDNMTAHIGDFGLTRFKFDSAASYFADSISTSSTAIKGTIGYIAPECAAGGEVSTAGDVYSFGIILLELFIRKRPTDDMFKDGLNIVKFVEMNFPEDILRIIDPDLLEDEHGVSQVTSVAMKQNNLECILSVLKVGLCCANPSPNERMDMQGVAARLHGIKEAYLRGN